MDLTGMAAKEEGGNEQISLMADKESGTIH